MNIFSALLRETLIATLSLALPLLCIVTVLGIVLAVVQAVTSVQDQNAVVLPKLIVAAICIAGAAPAGMHIVMNLFKRCVLAIPAITASSS